MPFRFQRLIALTPSIFAGLVIWLFDAVPALAADAAADESVVRSWVRKLDADRKADRQQAEDQLLKFGPAVLNWLPEPESLGSPAAIEAIRRVRAKLERQKAESVVEASRMKSGGRMTVEEVLKRLTVETGNVVLLDELPRELLSKPVELPERATFWEVIELLSQRHLLEWHIEGAGVRITPPGSPLERGGKKEDVGVALVKGFRVAVRSVAARRVVGNGSSLLARFDCSVASEPRLRPLFLKVAVDDLEVTSVRDKAESAERWPAFSPGAKLELTFGHGQRQQSFPADFRLPMLAEPKTVSLRGKLHIETAAAEESLDFPPGTECRGVSRRRGGVTVRVENWETDANSNGRDLTVRVSVTYDSGGPAFESHRSWMLSNIAGLLPAVQPRGAVGAELKLLKPTQHDIDLRPDGAILVVYRFEGLPRAADGYRFRYVAPTLILNVPLEFEMRDIKWPMR